MGKRTAQEESPPCKVTEKGYGHHLYYSDLIQGRLTLAAGVSSPVTDLTFGFLGDKFGQCQLLHGGISQDARVGWFPAAFDHG